MFVILLASGTAALALSLLVGSNAPYDRAFGQQHGAHLVVVFDGTKAKPDQLRSSGETLGALAAGPWPAVQVPFEKGGIKYALPVEVIGRSDPGGPVDVLRIASGRWPSSDGEIAVTRSFANANNLSLGDRLTALSVPDKPALIVVGTAIDVDQGPAELATQSAWVVPSQVAALSDPDRPSYVVAYRFTADPTTADLKAARARLQLSLRDGSVSSSYDYLLIRSVYATNVSLVLAFLLAFSLVALAAGALMTVNLVAATVLAARREIGVMKAVGFTNWQVVGAFVWLMVLPALVGCAVGVPLGMAGSLPFLAQTSAALELPLDVAISPVAGLAAALTTLLVVGVSAAVPALRAGRLSPVQALADVGGKKPSRAGWTHALKLPLTIELGLGMAFGRPLRAALTTAAVIAGVATLTFALGLHLTLERLGPDITLEQNIQVQVTRLGSYSDEKVTSILQQQPETSNVVAAYYGSVKVPGLEDPVSATALRGDSSRLGYPLLAGRWFSGPGETVAPAGLLRDAHLKIGDTIEGSVSGVPVSLRIVGEEFDVVNFGHILRFDAATWKEAIPSAQPDVYFVQLRPGTDAAAYATRVQRAEPDFISAQVYSLGVLGTLDVLNQVLIGLVVVLAAIASVGVFASVLLSVRERVRDTAVLRAVGMSPDQVAVMWAAAAGALGTLGGLLGVAAGVALHGAVLVLIGEVIGSGMPSAEFLVFGVPVLVGGVLAGTALALLGASLPARMAARLTPARALVAE